MHDRILLIDTAFMTGYGIEQLFCGCKAEFVVVILSFPLSSFYSVHSPLQIQLLYNGQDLEKCAIYFHPSDGQNTGLRVCEELLIEHCTQINSLLMVIMMF